MGLENKHIHSIISGSVMIFLKKYRQQMAVEGGRTSLEQEQTP